MKIRKAVAADASALAQLVSLQPMAAHWDRAGFEAEIHQTAARIYCAQEANEVVGFIAARAAGGEGELLNLAVHPSYTRSGIGYQLLLYLLTQLQTEGVTRLTLEADQQNAPANALYAKAGFQRFSQRKDFYGPGKHAWIWGKNL